MARKTYKKRYNKKPKITSVVKNVFKNMSETKQYDLASSGTYNNGNPLLVRLDNVTKGTGDLNRIGEKIQATSLRVRLKSYLPSENEPTNYNVKMLIVQSRKGPLTSADFNLAGLNRYQNSELMRILREETALCLRYVDGLPTTYLGSRSDATGRDFYRQEYYIKFPKGLNITYNVSTGATNKNNLYLLLWAEEGVNLFTCYYDTRLTFKDL